MNTLIRTLLATAAAFAPVGVATATATTEPPDSAGDQATAAPQPPIEITACLPSNSQFRAGTDDVITIPDPGGDITLERRRGFTWRGRITASDPRLEGTHYYSFDADVYTLADGGPGPDFFAEGHRIENDEGAWQGSAVGFTFSPDHEGDAGPVVLIGEGAYEGLTAVLITYSASGCFLGFEGLIMEVPAPPVPYTGE